MIVTPADRALNGRQNVTRDKSTRLIAHFGGFPSTAPELRPRATSHATLFYFLRVRGRFRGPVSQARSTEELLKLEAGFERRGAHKSAPASASTNNELFGCF